MKDALEIVIIGVSGLIGETLLQSIVEHEWLSGHVQLLGGEEATGQLVESVRQQFVVGDVALFEFSHKQVVISTGEEDVGNDWLEQAQDAGCIILDIGSKLLVDYDLPPVVAEVNPEVIRAVANGGIIALPDAATTQLVTLLKPIIDSVDVIRASVVSCHAISEMGRSGVEEMVRQTAQLLNGKPISPLVFSKQIAFNLIPLVGRPQSNGQSDAELRIIGDTKQVLSQQSMDLSVSCCWVPVFFGHSQSIDLQLRAPMSEQQLRERLTSMSGIKCCETSDFLPTAVTEASGEHTLAVGRIKSDLKNSTGFSLWTVADNLRFGNAGNAVKILEVLVKGYL